MKQFIVVRSEIIEALEEHVNDYMSEGYNLSGNMFYAGGYFHQPMQLIDMTVRLMRENEELHVKLAKITDDVSKVRIYEPNRCHADRDGECDWVLCPQLQDNEPHKSGRHCPLDTMER